MRQRYFFTSMTRIADLADEGFEVEEVERSAWATGDYVAVEVATRASGQRIELTSGRQIEVAEGDLVVGALGHRYATLEATGSWQAVGRDGRMSLLTGAGLLGKCTSRSTVTRPLTRVVYRGHLLRDGTTLAMSDFVEDVPPRDFDAPVVMLIGTSMSAGKTTAARVVTRLLAQEGLRVLGSKVTGAGRYRDVLTMGDAGAETIYDFMDVGLPSSIVPEPVYRRALDGLMSRWAAAEPDVAVVEVGASPLEPYNGSVAVERLQDHVAFTLLCASDPYAVVGIMAAYDATPDLVSGPASNTRAGVDLTQELSGVRTVNVRDREALPELRVLLLEALQGRS